MIYQVLKVLVKLTLFFFFKRRVVRGMEHIPKSGATILVANHPVTFLDPLLVAVSTNRPVYFLAKGAMFKNGLIRAIFKAFNMIPIYRAQDDPKEMSKNQDTFKYCYEHLEKGGLILIFPEGISVTDRTLKPLKTGVARIALGAEERNDFNLGVQIVPIGLTYERPHEFRKDVLVQVGKPIKVAEYKSLYQLDNRDAVHVIIDRIKNDLEQLSLQVANPQFQPLVDFLIQENKEKEVPFEQSVESIKELLNNVEARELNEKQILLEKMDEVLIRKQQIGLDNVIIGSRKQNLLMESFFSILTLIIGVPLLLFGFVHNAIPYYFSPIIARKISKEYEYQGPIAMTAGMVICLIIYPLFFVLMLLATGSLVFSLIYLISLPFVGLVVYGFSSQLRFLVIQWKLVRLFQTQREQLAELVLLRKQVLVELGVV